MMSKGKHGSEGRKPDFIDTAKKENDEVSLMMDKWSRTSTKGLVGWQDLAS